MLTRPGTRTRSLKYMGTTSSWRNPTEVFRKQETLQWLFKLKTSAG
jgi:hypothetical protein